MNRRLENASRAQNSSAARMSAEDRRKQIVHVAMSLFSERGFRGATTKEIAQAAGVSEAIIFRHFATKEDLYSAIIDHKACAATDGGGDDRTIVEAIRASVADLMRAKDDRAVFEHIALQMMRHHEADTDFLRLLFYSALEGHELSEMFWTRNVRAMYELLGGYIASRQREGALRAVAPNVVVRAFSGMIIHHSVTNILWDKARGLLNISNEDAAREFTRILFDGIHAEGERTDSARKRAARRSVAKAAGRTRADAVTNVASKATKTKSKTRTRARKGKA